MIRLLLVRHGLTDWNAQERFLGQSDIGLNAAGLRQAHALGRRLAGESWDRLVCSDLLRARKTAEVVQAAHGQEAGEGLCSEPRLREISFGAWEGLTYRQIQGRAPQAMQDWQADLVNQAPPQGENLRQLAGRVQAVFDELRQDAAPKSLLLVAHGGPLQVLVCLALGLPPGTYWQFHIAPASLSEICLYPEGAILNRLNDTCHLDGIYSQGHADRR